MSNMPAEPLLDERHVLSESAFVELVVWRVPVPVRGSKLADFWSDVEEMLR